MLLKEDIDPALAIDVSYRLGVAFDDCGMHKKAIAQWKHLMRSKSFPKEHQTISNALLVDPYRPACAG